MLAIALDGYKKKPAPLLFIESSLKAAKYENICPALGVPPLLITFFFRVALEMEEKAYASQLLSGAYSESELLSIQEKVHLALMLSWQNRIVDLDYLLYSEYFQIQLATVVAMIFQQMDMERKFAFYVREAALLSKSIVLPHKAHALLKLTAPFYQLPMPFSGTN